MSSVLSRRNEWFDLYHVHPNEVHDDDRWSRLAAAWSQVESAGRATGLPFQTWLLIVASEPMEDAAYVHTPNPNQTEFPYSFDGVMWGAKPPSWVAASADTEFGYSRYEGAELFWARKVDEG